MHKLTISILALAMVGVALPALAAEPAEGGVSPDAPAAAWQGPPATTSNPTTLVDSSLGCRASTRSVDPSCDRFFLTVEPPASGLYNLEIATDAPDGQDYDLYVFSGDSLVGHSAGATGDETVVLSQLPAGTYEVVVEAWLVAPGTTYAGSAFLDTSVTEEETARAYHGTPVPPGFEDTPANAPANKKGQPLVVEAHKVPRDAAEPTIGVNRDGTAFFAAGTFDAAVAGLARTEVMRSRDGGATWESVQPDLPPPVESEPGVTLDPYVYVEEDTGRVFSIDLTVACAYLLYSDDEGETWTRNPLACGDFINDHHTLYAAPPPPNLETQGFPEVLYYCFNRVADSSCGRSVDGGDTFVPTRDPAYIGVNDEGELCGGLHAHLASDGDGRIFLPKGHCGKASVSISEDGGDTWQVVTISDHVEVADHEVNIAVDSAGNLYALWFDGADRLPYLAHSTDHGQTWSTPRMIAPPGVHEVNFPTLAAGDPGRIAITFPGNPTQARGDLTRPWNSYVVVSTNALDEEPLFTWTTANDPADPVHRGNCGPGRCGNMFDFLDIVVSPHDGALWATAVDTCTGACVTDPSAAPDDMDGIAIRQVRGPSLWAPGHKQ